MTITELAKLAGKLEILRRYHQDQADYYLRKFNETDTPLIFTFFQKRKQREQRQAYQLQCEHHRYHMATVEAMQGIFEDILTLDESLERPAQEGAGLMPHPGKPGHHFGNL